MSDRMSYFLTWGNRICIAIACNHNCALLVGSANLCPYCLKTVKSLPCGVAVWIRSYGDNGNLWINSTQEVRRRRGAAAVMSNLEYLGFQRKTTHEHPILGSGLNIPSQQEIHRAVGNTEDHRILILISIQRFRRVKNQGSDFSPSVKLPHSLRRCDHTIVYQRLIELLARKCGASLRV